VLARVSAWARRRRLDEVADRLRRAIEQYPDSPATAPATQPATVAGVSGSKGGV
jgi:phage tail sheath gpL-like